MRPEIRNLFCTLAVVALAGWAGAYSYWNPSPILRVAELVVSSISIIFGLSLALITFAANQPSVSSEVIPKKDTRRGLEQDIAWENDRTILRQQFFVTVFMLTVVLGIVIVAFEKTACLSCWYAWVIGAFAFFTTLSLAIAFVLPFSISATIKRDRFFRLSSNDGG